MKEVTFFNIITTLNILGLAVGSAVGMSTSDLVGSMTKNILNPLMEYAFGLSNWNSIYLPLGNSKLMVGEFASDLISYAIILITLFAILRYVFYTPLVEYIKSTRTDNEILTELKKLNQRATITA